MNLITYLERTLAMKYEKYYPIIRQQQCVLCGKSGGTLAKVQTVAGKQVYVHPKCLGDNTDGKVSRPIYGDIQK